MGKMKRVCAFLLAMVMVLGALPTAMRVEVSATNLFEDVCYIGDPALCSMPADMAQVYADVLADMHDSDADRLKAYLVDLASDGMPILVTMYVRGNEIWGPNSTYPRFWCYKSENGTAVEYDFLEDFYREGTGEYCAIDGYSIETLDEGAVWVVHGSTGADYGRWVYYRMDGGRLIPTHVEECYYYDFNGFWLDGVNYDSHEAVLQELGAVAGEYDGDFSAYSNYYSSFCVMDYARELMVSVPNEGGASALRSELLQYAASLGDSGSQTADSGTDVDPLELFSDVAYIGDRAACQMTAEMARAYADAISSLPASEEIADGLFMYTKAVLIDIAGDGYPLLMTGMESDEAEGATFSLWEYRDGRAVQYDAAEDCDFAEWVSSFAICMVDNKPSLYVSLNYCGVIMPESGFMLYDVSHAQLTLLHTCKFENPNGVQGTMYLDGQAVYDGADAASRWNMGWEMRTLAENMDTSEIYVDMTDVEAVESALRAYASAKGGVEVDSWELLESIYYIGDPSNCKMSKEMALAYADVLDGIDGSDYYALLADVSGDGYPVLFTAAAFRYDSDYAEMWDFCTWEYKGGAARKFEYAPSNVSIYQCAEGVFLRASSGEGEYGAWGGGISIEYYQVEKGLLVEVGSVYTDYEGEPYISDLVTQVEGIEVTPEYELAEIAVTEGDYYQNFASDVTVTETASVLRAYAAAYSGYSYPRAETVDEAALVEAIAAAVAEAVGGEVTAIYKLADGVYYVIITVNGVQKGAVVTGGKTNGEVSWNVEEVHDEPLTQEELDEVARGLTSMMNMEFNYDKLQTGDPDDAYEALEESLENMPGVTPNDPAKNAIVEYIQSAISSNYSTSVSSRDNRFVLNGQTVQTLAEQARQEKQRYDELLLSHGVTLNKPITIIIRILWNDMDAGVPCQVTLDGTLLEALSGCTAQLLLGDAQHYLQISAENLESLIAAYGTVHVQLAREEEGCYVINFLDENEQLIERLETPVTIALPAPTELSTIMVYYEDGSANWGGQYDPNARLLSFDASYTGRYEVFDNSVQIDDIDELDENTKQAISFLAANGYMDVAEGRFRPNEPLTRYEFAQAMVGMFFALDSSQQTSFTDVPEDSPYYVYVASGEALNLINGFSDGTFGGDLNISKQQLLALTARTLIERKDYVEPTNPDEYLRAFKDAAEIGDWARSQVALSVREELVERGGNLYPQGDVTRSEAALILYRLFLLLHEVPSVQLELPEVTEIPEEPQAPEEVPAEPTEPDAEEIPAEGEETTEPEELDGADKKGSAEKKDAGKLITVVAASAAGCAVVFGGGGAGLWWLLKKRKLK